MNKKFYEDTIREYAKRHQIHLLYPDPQPGMNEAAQCRRTIWVGKFDNGEELFAAFFHEVGHCSDSRTKITRNHRLPRFEHELRAWTVGFQKMHEFGMDATKRMYRYMMRCLNKYNRKDNRGTKGDKK